MKLCKAKNPDGKPCPNQVDKGQEYCPYHLAEKDAKAKSILSFAGTIMGVVITGIVAVTKFVVSKKL
jgi:hypothetical protein